MRSKCFTTVWLAAIALMPHGAAAGQERAVADGRRLAEINCEPCHAIGTADRSTVALAPPFRTFVASGRIAQLQGVLTDNARMAHEEMPQSQFAQTDIAALIAYIESLAQDANP